MKSARLYYRELPCLVPGCNRNPVCFSHFPKHTGHGGGKDKWRYDKGVPLCDHHHNVIDARNGSGKQSHKASFETRGIVGTEAPYFWEKMSQLYSLDMLTLELEDA
jgi:hypothetical protein